eukprot:CAMPEP_0178952850 /NCGR_PEP_ID=MMETSP0789-20121207/8084_1 /TAXON_ID=3005 /ORGANISM="Rhizosolenia setigera, Strain CCMP 1694" /LENGTH=240 /DNA_ID=CAMNT_0020634027 /DNA_START=152 /DNA_END=874 /DNA_ORIENTATION=+
MKETFVYGYAPLSVIQDRVERGEQTDWDLHEAARVALSKGVVFFNRKDAFEWVLGPRKDLLNRICDVAAEEGRIDILDEILDNIKDGFEKNSIFCDVDGYAASGGKLDVIKWFEAKGLSIRRDSCARGAAYHGQLHILQWLQEEQGLELKKYLYNYAIDGGQLHVLKWLREQEVPWDVWTFYSAARKGNLNILQWLHDEGCPWHEDDDDNLRVHEEDLKPETLDWCRVNGYRHRIVFRND